MNTFQQILEDLENRPWHEKFFQRVRFYIWDLNLRLAYFTRKRPEYQRGISHACNEILEDIEFGYDTEMIASKIKSTAERTVCIGAIQAAISARRFSMGVFNQNW